MGEQTQKPEPQATNAPPSRSFFSVDLIRTVAIFLVILLHAAIQYVAVPWDLQIQTWWTYSIYNSIARPCVPLFVMLSGYLLLQPSKVNEPLRVFFKKRWARIGLPFIFWSIIYFFWVWMFDGGSLTWAAFQQGILQGPYVTFWFLYMLIGLYLLTPLLRVFVAYSNETIKKFVLIIWFIGTGLMPIASLLGYNVSSFVFILPGWIGYFLLGAYLAKFKLSSKKWRISLIALMLVGYVWTILASAFMEIEPGPQLNFFYDYMTANVIIAATAIFLLLTSISVRTIETKPKRVQKALSLISENTLSIYLLHMILLEAFQKGVFGFTINTMTLNPIIMTPLFAALILVLSVCIVVPLKKVPILKHLIG